MFSDLDPILHSQLRLAIVSLLIAEEKADFARIKEITKATSGNISVQIQKLEAVGYISVTKSFKDNYPQYRNLTDSQGITRLRELCGSFEKLYCGQSLVLSG